MVRIILVATICAVAFAATPVTAQSADTDAPPAPALPSVPPAPNDGQVTPSPATPAPQAEPKPEARTGAEPKQPGVTEAKPNVPAETKPDGASAAKPKETPQPKQNSAAEAKPGDNPEGRYTFNRTGEGYVRLDNRTGQVSYCSQRSVGWTCQLAAEDRGALENEIARLQGENATLKKELLTRGLPLPGTMKPEPPVAENERPPFSQPNDPNLERMKAAVEKAWRQLMDMMSTLQRDLLKKD